MLVVPNKYVNELRAIPEEKLSSMVANIDVGISTPRVILDEY